MTTLTLPAVVIFLAATVVLVWWFGLRLGYAVIAVLAGLYLADTAAAPPIHHVVASLGHWLSTL